MKKYPLSLLSHVSALGTSDAEAAAFLFDDTCQPPLTIENVFGPSGNWFVGRVKAMLPEVPAPLARFDSRLARIALLLARNAETQLQRARDKYAARRVGIILGTSTSGISAAEDAFIQKQKTGNFPENYSYTQQEIGAVAQFVAEVTGFCGPTYTISTACSSSAKAFRSARALLEAGMCDAVITGGIDALCRLTVSGFSSLELISPTISNPFSANRNGLNIGEGGALFLMENNAEAPFCLRGVGESSDAYHISTPHPDALGAIQAIESALSDAHVTRDDIAYLNLHGTGTIFNDRMESKAVSSVLGNDIPCSSTKPLTGHTLGAAGALEAAISCLALANKRMPMHRFDGKRDDSIEPIQIVSSALALDSSKIILSNSFAFGGSNCCVAIGAL